MENLVNLGEESLTQGLVFKLPWVTCEATSLGHNGQKPDSCKLRFCTDYQDTNDLQRQKYEVHDENSNLWPLISQGHSLYQWCSQKAEKVRHIKGRLLDQAVVLFNCVPFQSGNFS